MFSCSLPINLDKLTLKCQEYRSFLYCTYKKICCDLTWLFLKLENEMLYPYRHAYVPAGDPSMDSHDGSASAPWVWSCCAPFTGGIQYASQGITPNVYIYLKLLDHVDQNWVALPSWKEMSCVVVVWWQFLGNLKNLRDSHAALSIGSSGTVAGEPSSVTRIVSECEAALTVLNRDLGILSASIAREQGERL